MSNNAVNINTGVDMSAQVDLMDAIEDTIEDIAVGEMTHTEVVGILEMIKAKYTAYIVLSHIEDL